MKNWERIEIIKKSPMFRWADIIIIALLIVAAALATMLIFEDGGDRVEITNNGIVREYDINFDRKIVIDDKLTVVIEKKQVYVVESTCDDHVCERFRKISRVNEIIVCSPNNIFIKIIGKSDLDWVMQ